MLVFWPPEQAPRPRHRVRTSPVNESPPEQPAQGELTEGLPNLATTCGRSLPVARWSPIWEDGTGQGENTETSRRSTVGHHGFDLRGPLSVGFFQSVQYDAVNVCSLWLS